MRIRYRLPWGDQGQDLGEGIRRPEFTLLRGLIADPARVFRIPLTGGDALGAVRAKRRQGQRRRAGSQSSRFTEQRHQFGCVRSAFGRIGHLAQSLD